MTFNIDFKVTTFFDIDRVVFEAEASGGGSKAGGLPHPPLSLPFPFPLSFQTNQWEGRSDPVRGSSPASPLQIPPWTLNISETTQDRAIVTIER